MRDVAMTEKKPAPEGIETDAERIGNIAATLRRLTEEFESSDPINWALLRAELQNLLDYAKSASHAES